MDPRGAGRLEQSTDLIELPRDGIARLLGFVLQRQELRVADTRLRIRRLQLADADDARPEDHCDHRQDERHAEPSPTH